MRKKVFGQEVRAEDVERLPAEGGPTTFVRLCAALIGQALAEQFGHFAVPQVTERILVADGGVDAEYVSRGAPAASKGGSLIAKGRTAVQIKYRDIAAAPRATQIRGLASALRGELTRRVPVCDRYVLMTNLHLTGTQHRKLRAVLDTFDGIARQPNLILGASEIALRLNRSPHLRHLFFSTDSFCTLDFAEEELKAAYATVGWPSFINRADECRAIETFVRDAGDRVMHVIGPRYVGKTRLAFEALRPYGAQVIWATRPEGVSLDILRDLDLADDDVILVVDNCGLTSARTLVEAAESR